MNWTASRRRRSAKQAFVLSALRKTFALLSALAPGLAARLALWLFLKPPHKPRLAPAELECMSRAKRIDPSAVGGVAAWSWGQGPAVVLVHGWGGRGSQMCAFVEPLVRAGFRVISFDGPAHGESPGVRTDVVAFSRALGAVMAHVGEVEAVVGHSFGASCALVALQRHAPLPKKVALISCPPNGIWVTERFGAVLGIGKRVLQGMRDLLEQRYPGVLKWEDLSCVKMAARLPMPVLLVHDKEDQMVPYAEAAVLFVSEVSALEHLATEGFGHRRVLNAPVAIDKTLTFLSRSARTLVADRDGRAQPHANASMG